MQLLPKDPLRLSTQFRVGRGVKRVYTDEDRHLIFEMTDGQKIDIGVVEGEKGETGPQGPQGEPGPAGATGPAGEPGKGGAPGIVISGTQPTDEAHPVWLDPDGDASAIPWVPQPTTAAVGQIVKVKAVDSEGRITEVEAADIPSGGGAETWEIIREITIPEGAEETSALTIDKDDDGQPFALKKARLISLFPPYSGATTIPTYSFSTINGALVGNTAPLAYTGVYPKLKINVWTGSVWEVALELDRQAEMVVRGDTSNDVVGKSRILGDPRKYYAPARISTITSIGGTQMIICPGCTFKLYGVRV